MAAPAGFADCSGFRRGVARAQCAVCGVAAAGGGAFGWANGRCRFTAGGRRRLAASLAKDWGQWLPAHGLWVRFGTAAGDGLGGLLLCRDTPWVEGEGLLLQELAGAYEHAWHALAPPPPWWRKLVLDRDRRWLMLAIVLVFCFPVRQSVLAPAEVVAADPTVVRSPMEGVVDRFHLEPNDVVAKDQLLITLDDTDLSNRLEVSRKALAVAEAEYRRAAQQAVFDNKSRAELTILKSRMDQQAAEVAYMDDLMARSQVKAPHAGIAIFSDPHDWMGKPVAVGERLLMVADPQRWSWRCSCRSPISSIWNRVPKW